jgi:cysteine desulfurase
MIYLDNAATTPVREEVINVIQKSMLDDWGNPSSTHNNGRKAKAKLEVSRRLFAKDMGADSGEIFFTSGATESIYLALLNFVENGAKHLIACKTEHKAVLDSVAFLADKHGISHSILDVSKDGLISLEALQSILAQEQAATCAVAIMHTNNESGVIQALEDISQLCREHDAFFFCDAVQSGLTHSIHVKELGIHGMSFSAHKMYGPKGVGLLYLDKALKRTSLTKGGGQERGLRPGTENMPGILGFAKAWELARKEQASFRTHTLELKQHAIQLIKSKYPEAYIGSGEAPHILHFGIPTTKKTDTVLMELDLNNVCLSAGSACQSGSHKQSHVVEAMGLPTDFVYLRMSFGKGNTKSEIDYAIAHI